jgi:hypothetical protein
MGLQHRFTPLTSYLALKTHEKLIIIIILRRLSQTHCNTISTNQKRTDDILPFNHKIFAYFGVFEV